ncbi:MAG: response regulator [Candidatus Bathyarchaeota archaeon]
MAQSTVMYRKRELVNLSDKASTRVLHVDDETSFVKVAKQIIEMQGEFQVDTASSAQEAWEKIKRKTFDAIVCDYMMPGKNGLEFLKELRDSGNNIPFIIFTGKSREEVAIRALNLGADWYFHKIGAPETVYGELAYGIHQVVEKKRTEKALQESEKWHRMLLSSITDSVWVLDKDWCYSLVNNAGSRLVNMSPDQLMGRKLTELFPGIEKTEFFAAYEDSMKKQIAGNVTAPFTLPNGKVGFYEVRIYPVTDGILCIGKDITERKQAEKMKEEINRKLNLIGSLTQHNVRGKLSAVAGNTYLAKKTLPSNHKALKHLDIVESDIAQVESIFDFAKMHAQMVMGFQKPMKVDVAKSVDDAAEMITDLEGAKLVNECQGLTVLADPMLKQLFYNLIDNSLKHGEKVHKMRVHYREGKDKLEIIYEDDGVGIPESEKEKIFNGAYGENTGYGLFLTREICGLYGWTIQETGKQGNGAQFVIIIPKMNKESKRTP